MSYYIPSSFAAFMAFPKNLYAEPTYSTTQRETHLRDVRPSLGKLSNFSPELKHADVWAPSASSSTHDCIDFS